MSPVESILKKTVIVLSIILALMLIYLTARSFYRSHSTALAESAAAVPEAAPIPESEPEPESVPVSRGAPLILLDDEEISSEIRRIAEEHEAVGIQVSIINDGEVIASFADGWATIDDDPMTVDHKIRIASVSKVIVGMTAMLLQEDGVIDDLRELFLREIADLPRGRPAPDEGAESDGRLRSGRGGSGKLPV